MSDIFAKQSWCDPELVAVVVAAAAAVDLFTSKLYECVVVVMSILVSSCVIYLRFIRSSK